MKSSYNYKTFYTGTPGKLEECPLIYFYSSGKLDFTLSITELDKLKDKIASGKLVYCERGKDGLFTKSLEGLKNYSFDLIVYCDTYIDGNSKNNPIIGYTLFSEPQRTYTVSGNTFGEIIISISFIRNESEESEAIIDILNTFRIVQSEVDFSGEERYSFPITSDIIPEPEDTYLKFSGRVIDLKNDHSLVSITDTGIVYHEKDSLVFSSPSIISGIPLEDDLYTSFFLGVYQKDLVICKLDIKTGSYCLSSLSKTNRFGNSYNYLSGYINTDLLDGYSIMSYVNSYLIFWKEYNQSFLIYFMEDNTYEIIPRSNEETGGNNYIVADSRDLSGNYHIMSDIDLINEIKKTCITPMKKNYSGEWEIDLDSKNYIYQEKIGSWWILKNRATKDYYYLSPYGFILSSHKLFLINDRIFMTDTGVFFPVVFGHSYKYPVHSNVKDTTLAEMVGIKITSSQKWGTTGRLEECFLDGLRRRPIRMLTCFPPINKIIGSIFGLIFYKDNGHLYYY